MDVMRPKLINLDGVQFRVNPFFHPAINPSGEETAFSSYNNDEEFADPNLVETVDGFQLAFHVPQALYKFIIGKKGETKRRIEQETGTRLSLPPNSREEDSDVVINGGTARAVLLAKSKIDLLVANGRQRLEFTHFISIPFNANAIIDSFEKFKKLVIAGNPCLNPGLFQTPSKLHLTLCTLQLLDGSEMKRAEEILEEVKLDIQPHFSEIRPKLSLNGLEYMNDDPSAVDVLYGKIASEDIDIQSIADIILERFYQSGLSHDVKTSRVKLHVTLLNSLFLSDEQHSRQTFDARNIFKNFKDFHFGKIDFNCVQLSQRHSTTNAGYYRVAAHIDL